MAALLAVALNTYGEDTDLPPTEGILKTMNEPLVPLSDLALDLDTTGTALANKLANRVLLDDLGRPAIDRPIARQLIAEKTAADRAAHERAQRRAAELQGPLSRNQRPQPGQSFAAAYPPPPAARVRRHDGGGSAMSTRFTPGRLGAEVLGVDFADRIISVVVAPYGRPALVEYDGEIWEECSARAFVRRPQRHRPANASE